ARQRRLLGTERGLKNHHQARRNHERRYRNPAATDPETSKPVVSVFARPLESVIECRQSEDRSSIGPQTARPAEHQRKDEIEARLYLPPKRHGIAEAVPYPTADASRDKKSAQNVQVDRARCALDHEIKAKQPKGDDDTVRNGIHRLDRKSPRRRIG